jgi:4-diphosphocytidyl-2-C-methyl-D-erythritol kinase
MKRLTLRPHAKINLGLRILGLRSDGYHDIQTRFQTIDLTDEMEMEVAPGGVDLRVEGARLATDRTNLVVRAAEALREGRRGLPGVRIRLLKRIPPGGGLGGGSSDAALALLGLHRLWEMDLDPGEIRNIAARLGADVPFFLEGGTALGEGKGDEIRPLPDIPPCRICLLLAPYEFSTKEAYDRWDPEKHGPASRTGSRWEATVKTPARETGETVWNDLQRVVCEAHPELGHYLDLFLEAGSEAASISGSGPSLFGLFRSEEASRRFLDSRDWHPFRMVECRPVSRAEYLAKAGLGPLEDPGSS